MEFKHCFQIKNKGVPTVLKKIVLSIFIIFLLAYGVFAQTAQTITLKPGFNFISFSTSISSTPAQLKTQNPAIEDIYLFSAAAGSFLSATEGTLSTLAAGKGYIIKSSSASDNVINVPGDTIQIIGNINLKTGFNLIGFSKIPPTTVSFSSLMNVYSAIKGIYKWSPAAGSFIQVVRDNSGTVTLLDGADPSFKAGESYFFNLTEDTTINYDGSNIILGNGPPAPIAKTLELTGTVGASATASPSYSLTRAIDLSTMQISVYDEINNLDVEGATINATGTNIFKATLPVATTDRYLSVLVKNAENKIIYKTFLGRVPKATEVTENTIKISNIKVSDESTARAIIVLENRSKIPITAVIAKKSVDASINNTEFALALEERIAGLEDRVPELKQAVNLIANVLTTPGVDNAIKEKVTEITFSESSKLLSSYVSLLQDANTLQTVNNISVPTQLYIGNKQITAQSTQVDIYETVAGLNETIGQRVEMPVLDPPPGQYNSAIAVKMTCATPNANIIYDYGDGNPGITYTAPVSINKTCTLNVAAFRSDWPMSWHSKFVNATYTIGSGSGETTETKTLAYISLDKTSEIIVVTTEKYNLSNVKITAHYSNGDSKEVQSTRWEMVSSLGIFSDMDNSYLPWGKTGEAFFNVVYSENGIEKRVEFKLMIRTQEELDKLIPLQLTLSKTTDSVQIGNIYDLNQIIVTAHYGDGNSKIVIPAWSILSGDGVVNQNIYTAPQNNVMVKLLCKYVEYNRSVSSEIELNVCNLENGTNNQTQEVNVIDSQNYLITTAGGKLTLKNGITLEIPQSSVQETSSIVLSQITEDSLSDQTIININLPRNINEGLLKIPVYEGFKKDFITVWVLLPTMKKMICLNGQLDSEQNYYVLSLKEIIQQDSINMMKNNAPSKSATEDRIDLKFALQKIEKENADFIEKIKENAKINGRYVITMPFYLNIEPDCWTATWLSLLKGYKATKLDTNYDTMYKLEHQIEIGPREGLKHNWDSKALELPNDRVYINWSQTNGKFKIEDKTKELLDTPVSAVPSFNRYCFVMKILKILNQGIPVFVGTGGHTYLFLGYDINGLKFSTFDELLNLVQQDNNIIKFVVHDPRNMPYRIISLKEIYDEYQEAIKLGIVNDNGEYYFLYYATTPPVKNRTFYKTIHLPIYSKNIMGIDFRNGETVVDNLDWDYLAKPNGYKTNNTELKDFNNIKIKSIPIYDTYYDNSQLMQMKSRIIIKSGEEVIYEDSNVTIDKEATLLIPPFNKYQFFISDYPIPWYEFCSAILPQAGSKFKRKISPNDSKFKIIVELFEPNSNITFDKIDVEFNYKKLFINSLINLNSLITLPSEVTFYATIGIDTISNNKINWSIAPSDAGAAITAGILSVTPNAAGKSFTIKGIVNDPESIHNGKEAFFEVNNKILKIEAPYDQIQTHWTSYQLFALYGEETVTNEVDWSIEPANGGLSFNSGTKGLLKIEDTVGYGEYIIKIKYTIPSNPDVIIEAKKPITVIKRTVANPTFSPEGGLCQFPINVTISCQTKDAKIKYTIDDSDPITSNTAITSLPPITVNLVGTGDSSAKSATIKAIAFRQGMADTDICSASYSYIANPDLRIICSIDNYEIRNRLTLFKVFVAGASQQIDSVTLENPSDGAEITKLEPGGDYGYMFTSPTYTGTYSDDAIFYIKATSGTLTARFKITVIRPKN